MIKTDTTPEQSELKRLQKIHEEAGKPAQAICYMLLRAPGVFTIPDCEECFLEKYPHVTVEDFHIIIRFQKEFWKCMGDISDRYENVEEEETDEVECRDRFRIELLALITGRDPEDIREHEAEADKFIAKIDERLEAACPPLITDDTKVNLDHLDKLNDMIDSCSLLAQSYIHMQLRSPVPSPPFRSRFLSETDHEQIERFEAEYEKCLAQAEHPVQFRRRLLALSTELDIEEIAKSEQAFREDAKDLLGRIKDKARLLHTGGGLPTKTIREIEDRRRQLMAEREVLRSLPRVR